MGNRSSSSPGSQSAPKLNVLLYGGHESGKTSILTQLKPNAFSKIRHEEGVLNPTETLDLPDAGMKLETLGPVYYYSRMGIREFHRTRDQAFRSCDALVLVVDSDAEKFLDNMGWDFTRSDFKRILTDKKNFLKKKTNKPIVLLCNKSDLPNAVPAERIVNLLGLKDYVSQPIKVIECSAKTGEGLKEGLEWISLANGTTATKQPDGVVIDDDTASTGSSTTAGEMTGTSNSSSTSFVLDYEPTLLGGNATLQRFEPIQKNTQCPFAKQAKLWGGKSVMDASSISIEDQAVMNAEALGEFANRCKNNDEPLDGFCIELCESGVQWASPEEFGNCVRRLLTALADQDPAEESCMKVSFIGKLGWRFRYAGEDFFVTTFNGRYPRSSSRHAFGAQGAFVLLQPMSSFARHKLPPDTPKSATNWENPKTMRDKTRVAFKDAGRPYSIPETVPYPVAEHIVKPHVDDGRVIRWWE